jgi:hypothetical protein
VPPPGFDPFRVGPSRGRVFRGRCPRLLYRSPPGIQVASLRVAARLASCSFTIACRGKRYRDAQLQRRPNKKRGSGS